MKKGEWPKVEKTTWGAKIGRKRNVQIQWQLESNGNKLQERQHRFVRRIHARNGLVVFSIIKRGSNFVKFLLVRRQRHPRSLVYGWLKRAITDVRLNHRPRE